MPTATFFNLPPEKQERLMDAATREFCEKPYNDVSLNKIIQAANIPRGSFYMYFEGKEELFRYLFSGYTDQLLMVLEEALLREGGDVFAALTALFDQIQLRQDDQSLGGMGAMSAIVGRNGGMQKGVLLELVDGEAILDRLRELVNPDLLDLRSEGELETMLGMLFTLAGPLIYSAIQTGDGAGVRAKLVEVLNIFKRGMAKDKGPAGEIQ